MNRVTLIGRLGAGADIKTLKDERKVAMLSVATDAGYRNRETGDWVDRADWHRVVTFQQGLVEMLGKHGLKGRLVAIEGTLKTNKVGEGDAARYFTDVVIGSSGSIRFLTPPADKSDKPPKPDQWAEYVPPDDLPDDAVSADAGTA